MKLRGSGKLKETGQGAQPPSCEVEGRIPWVPSCYHQMRTERGHRGRKVRTRALKAESLGLSSSSVT